MDDRPSLQEILIRTIRDGVVKDSTPMSVGEHARGLATLRLLTLVRGKPTIDDKDAMFDAIRTLCETPDQAIKSILDLARLVVASDNMVEHLVHDLTGEDIDMMEILGLAFASIKPNPDVAAD